MKRIVLAGLIAIFTFVWVFPAAADQIDNIKQQKNTIDSQIKDINKKKKEIQNEREKLESENKDLAALQEAENKEYKELVEQVKALEEYIAELNEAVRQSEEAYEAQKELLKKRLRVMSESSGFSLIETLMKSESLTDFFERLEIIALISQKDKEIAEEMRIAKAELETKKKLKEDEKKTVSSQVNKKMEHINYLKASRAELEQRIKNSKAELQKLNQQEDELYKKSKEMDDLIKKLTESSKKTKYIGGNMQWPVPGRTTITSYYGERMHPILKVKKMHTGIDIAANSGDTIVAANDGTVILSEYQSGYGNTVVIDHGGGITTLYAHCSKLLVKKGDEVKAGQKIALVGSTGNSTGPHLHFEVRKDGKTRDPLSPIQ